LRPTEPFPLNEPSGSAPRPCLAITYGWALGTPGGVARHVQELSRALARAGADVVLVCVSAAGYTSFPRPRLGPDLLGTEVARELGSLGIEHVQVEPHALHWMLDGRGVKRALERLLARRRVDAVLSFYNEAAYLPALLAARGVLFGFIATWLSYRMALSKERQGKGLRGVLLRRANRRFIVEPYRRAQVLFANSEFTKGELVDVVGVDPTRIRVTYLGVRPDFAAIPRRPPERIRRLLFFGRVVAEKGIGDALAALGQLAREGRRDWTLRVVGSGHHDHVRRLAAQHGIEAQVELLAHQGDQALFRELEAAELAILPSHSESFGLSIAEAQAAGLAVVAYRAGSVPEVVEDGVTAWLAPLRDVEALAANLRRALDDPAATHRAGLAGRERVARLFSWDRTAARVLDGIRALQEAGRGLDPTRSPRS
jgi:glycogen(starch) synthase